MPIHGTLCFILRDHTVLLLKKSEGLFGAGKWHAPGGKIRPGESSENCAIRETFEESGLRVEDLAKIGKLFFFKNGQKVAPDWIVDVFYTSTFQGTIRGSREGSLNWFELDRLPLEQMWEDDRYWCKYLLERRRFEGWFYYTGDFERLADHRVQTSW